MPVTDTTIASWSTTVSDNSPARSDQIGGLLDDQVRNVRSVVRAEAENKQWVRLASAPTFVSATSFSVPGDQRTDFAVGRRVKATLSGSTKYGTILSRNFSGGVTTVTMDWDLETYNGSGESFPTASTLQVDGNATATFVAELRCELYDIAGSNVRIPARVSSSSYDANTSVTTVQFEAGSLPDLNAINPGGVRIGSAGIDNTIAEVQLGAFTPALFQSGWPNTVVAGQFQITADNTVGPFVITLPERQPDADYVPLIQPTDTNTAASGVQWALPNVIDRNTTAFTVVFTSAMTTGPVFTYDYVILRGQP